MPERVMSAALDLPDKRVGKARDRYDVTLPGGEAGLLIIATDRASAFDVVPANGLPGKGVFPVITLQGRIAEGVRSECFPAGKLCCFSTTT